MWLLPALSHLAAAASHLFYRMERAGGSVPPEGPVLLVANHPNSLFDPAVVAHAAGRPVRFLAKSPLFHDPKIGWLVRAAGSIPVYRAEDDPAQVGRNLQVFGAVRRALAAGSAVGIFPEGLSHSAPTLFPIKTGAARIALGAAEEIGGAFPVIPVGLVYRAKERFRSEALVVVGEAVRWDDLLPAGADEAQAVRELTKRIEAAMRASTLNLESWEDAPLVECAEAVYAAEFGLTAEPGGRLARVRQVVAELARLRAGGHTAWPALADELQAHAADLAAAGLTPSDLHLRLSRGRIVRGSLRRLSLLVLLALPALGGAAAYLLPHRLTGWYARRFAPTDDTLATYKLLGGAAVYAAWTLLLGIAAGIAWRPAGGALAIFLLPPLGLAALRFGDLWRELRRHASRLRGLRGGEVLERLRQRQGQLAARLEELRAAGAGALPGRPHQPLAQ
jgi:glycerol-3-phosphate O-acyltransferase / dihydroxyacetone phosphate acyltransferase